MSDLASLLDELKQEGTLDSEGRFLVDLVKAEEKLEQYRLPSPHHYILALVSSATAAGAHTIRVSRSQRESAVSFDGVAFGFAETTELFRSLLLGSAASETRLRGLATAVYGARSMPMVSLSLESWSGVYGVRLYLHDQEMTVQNLEESPWKDAPAKLGTRFDLSLTPTWLGQASELLLGVEPGPDEFRLLRPHPRYAYPAIHTNGVSLNTDRLGPWTLAAAVGMDYPGIRPLKLSTQRRLDFPGDGTWGGYIGFGDGPGAWLIVADGITYQFPADESNYPTSRAVIYCNTVRRDLSSTGLVQNAVYDELVASVRKAMDRIISEVSGQPMTAELRQTVDPLKEIYQRRRAS